MSENQRTLENLLVDEQEVSEELLYDLLNEYVRIGEQNGALITQGAFRDLVAKQKIVVVLLAQWARFDLEIAESEWLTPTEISEQSGIKSGTVNPGVRNLDEESLVEDDGGRYRLPARNFERAREYIQGGDEDE